MSIRFDLLFGCLVISVTGGAVCCGETARVVSSFQRQRLTDVWERHQVLDWVSNESPQFTDIVGDDRPELVCTRDEMAHRRESVDEATWLRAQPRPRRTMQAGLKPQEAAEHMTVPRGFHVQLAAGEPQIHQPIAMAFDERGRLWVAEAYTYPMRAADGQGQDKIVILEDTDGNGSLDNRKVFAEGLNLVSGLEVGFGGVWVGAAPDLLFIPDKDHDDVPDGKPEILLDGFGYQDTHETLNAFIWGPDGWLYGCHGVFTHSQVGKPGTLDADRIPLNAGVWRYHPLRHQFEVFARGTSNPWGVDFDEHGQAFMTACVIPHLWHVVQGGRYQRQGGRHLNPYLFDDIETIADHLHYTGKIQDHAWWGHEPNAPTSTLSAGGGHAHCGAMIYLGDNWPSEFRGQLFMNNIHGNRVNCDILQRRGSGYVGKHGKDMLIANDRWFRGINLRYGPDGGVYLIDWYDKNACHRTTPEIWDRSNGRVYKIVYGQPVVRQVDLWQASQEELLDYHTHANEWFVRMARKILQERGGDAALHVSLWKRFQQAATPQQQLRWLWTLHVTGGLDEAKSLKLLQHPNEYVRGWAIQLALESELPGQSLSGALAELAHHDTSPVVRLYLASALQRLPADGRWPIVEGLISHAEDRDDHNLPLMYWYGMEPLIAEHPSRAIELARRSRLPLITRFAVRRAAVDTNGLDVVVTTLAQLDAEQVQLDFLDELLQAFEGRADIRMPNAWQQAYDRLMDSQSRGVRDRVEQLAVIFGDRRVFPQLRRVLADSEAELARRQRAMEILLRGKDTELPTALLKVVHEPELRSSAIRGLAQFEAPQTPPVLLGMYPDLSVAQQSDVINTLIARRKYATALMTAIKNGVVPRNHLHAYHVRQLMGFNDELLQRTLRDVWGEIRETSAEKKESIQKWRTLLTDDLLVDASPGRGRQLFNKTCAACHRLFGEGGDIGPDITGSNRTNLDYLLENIIDPNAVMGRDYRMTRIETQGGRLLSGLILDENDSAVTMQTPTEKIVIAKTDIAERDLSHVSMMPERLLDDLETNAVRDLVAYLRSPVQVAIQGPKAPIDSATGQVPGAIEGERE